MDRKSQKTREQPRESQIRIRELLEENDKMKESLSLHRELAVRLRKLSFASASLLGSFDSAADDTELSSLECLAKLSESSAMKESEEQIDNAKVIVGKYLNRIMSLVADYVQKNAGAMSIISLLELAMKLRELFNFAEQRQIIPDTQENKGWKKSMAEHEALFAQIRELLSQTEEEDDEVTGQPEPPRTEEKSADVGTEKEAPKIEEAQPENPPDAEEKPEPPKTEETKE